MVLPGIMAENAWSVTRLIDDFADGAIEVVSINGTVSDLVAASVAGGTRQVDVEVVTAGLGLTRAQVDTDPTAQFILGTVLDVANNIPNSVVKLTYDAGGVGLHNLGAGDFSAFNEIRVTFDFLQLAGGSLSTTVRMTDGDGSSAVAALVLNTDIGTPTVGDDTPISFAFSSFGAQIDFARLSSIELSFDTGSHFNVDYRLEGIEAVPESSAVWLVVLSAGLTMIHRRRTG
jgi:hypothetical protein